MEPDKKTQAKKILLLEKESEIEEQKESEIKTEITSSSRFEQLINQKLNRAEPQVDLEPVELQIPKKEVENADIQPEIKQEVETEKVEETVFETTEKVAEDIDIEISKIKQAKPVKSKKFRFKLVVAVFAIVMGVCAGWTIGNAIAINNEAAALATLQEEYNVNLTQYMLKISQVDGINPSEDETSLSPITNIVTLHPQPQKNAEGYAKKSNWFDNLCNWLSNLFRR